MPAKTDRAYAAGLLDGEGTVGIYLRANVHSWYVSVRIGSTDMAILKWLQARWGGCVHPQRVREEHKLFWVWELSTKAADKFLSDVVDYVQIKHRQVENALAFRQNVPEPGKRLSDRARTAQEALAEAQMVLNRRGRDSDSG